MKLRRVKLRGRRPTVVVACSSQQDLDGYLRSHAGRFRGMVVLPVVTSSPLGLAVWSPDRLEGVGEIGLPNDDRGRTLVAGSPGHAGRSRRQRSARAVAARAQPSLPSLPRYAVAIVRCPDELAVCLADGCGWSGSDLQARTGPAGERWLLDEPRRRWPPWPGGRHQ
jgi:hypothetical protein